jgi:hypothetical protein
MLTIVKNANLNNSDSKAHVSGFTKLNMIILNKEIKLLQVRHNYAGF